MTTITLKWKPRAPGADVGTFYLYFRPALPDGTTLKRVEGCTRAADRPRAEAELETMRAALRARVTKPKAETCDRFFERYVEAQKQDGHTDADKKATRWRKWISPRIGGKAPAAVTRADVEDIRDALDAAIRAWEPGKASKIGTAISGKTAMNAWTALTSTFKEATGSKRRDLRVLDGKPNPCAGVKPPGDRRTRKGRRKTFLYPKEAAALLGCTAVPLEWREVYAIALYTYVRPGELRALRWSDVDLDAGLVHVSRAWDYQADAVKEIPKSDAGVRTVPIELALRPLLARMGKGKAPAASVVPCLNAFGEDHLAQLFRSHLSAAKVSRPALHASTHTHVQANFRSCRDSGITWLAMTGLDVSKIKRRAGHEKIDVTDGYVKLAEDLGGELGQPFGPLPASLLGSCEPSVNREPASVVTAEDLTGIRIEEVPEEGVECATQPGFSEVSGTACERARRGTPAGDEALRAQVTRLAGKARLLVKLLAGDERALAAELAEGLDALAGPGAVVVPLATRRR